MELGHWVLWHVLSIQDRCKSLRKELKELQSIFVMGEGPEVERFWSDEEAEEHQVDDWLQFIYSFLSSLVFVLLK